MLGNLRASPCWEHQLVLNSTFRGRWKSASRKNVSCGQPSVCGSSSCRVQTRARTVYCRAHDEGMWETVKRLLGHVPVEDEEGHETSPRYQCEWVDWVCVQQRGAHQGLSGPMIAERNPAVVTEVVDQLSSQELLHGCLQELHDASVLLDMQGFQWRPSWVELRDGKRPPEGSARDLPL